MNKKEQTAAHPQFKAEGNSKFKEGDFTGAGEEYEKALKCIGKKMIKYFFVLTSKEVFRNHSGEIFRSV